MQQAGFRTLAIVLALMLIVSGVVGILFAPREKGRDLAEPGSGRFDRAGYADAPAGSAV